MLLVVLFLFVLLQSLFLLLLGFGESLERQTDMTAQAPQFTDAVDPFVGSGLDVDPSRRRFQQVYDVFLHARLEVCYLGAFQDQCDIDVSDLVAVSGHDRVCVFHELGGIASLPPRIRVLEDLSDVRQGQGAEYRVHHRVVDDVSVGMGDNTELGLVDAALFDVLTLGIRPLNESG